MQGTEAGKIRWTMVVILLFLAAFCLYVMFPDARIWIFEHVTGRTMMR